MLIKVKNCPRMTQEELVNILKRAGTIVSKVSIGKTSRFEIMYLMEGSPATVSTSPGQSEVCQKTSG